LGLLLLQDEIGSGRFEKPNSLLEFEDNAILRYGTGTVLYFPADKNVPGNYYTG
jgi:hypothetical protein